MRHRRVLVVVNIWSKEYIRAVKPTWIWLIVAVSVDTIEQFPCIIRVVPRVLEPDREVVLVVTFLYEFRIATLLMEARQPFSSHPSGEERQTIWRNNIREVRIVRCFPCP